MESGKEQDDQSYRLKSTVCPVCKKSVDAATSLHGKGIPQKGNFTVCIYCSSILRFTEKMGLVAATADDVMMLAEKQPKGFMMMMKLQELVRQFLVEKAKKN